MKNILVFVIILAFGVIATLLSMRMPLMDSGEIGPGLIPAILSAAIGLCALIGIITELQKSKKSRSDQDSMCGANTNGDSKKAWLMMLYFAAYVFFMQWLGLFLATLLFCPPVIMLLVRLRWYKVCGISLAIAVCTFIIFSLIFKLGLPQGPFVVRGI